MYDVSKEFIKAIKSSSRKIKAYFIYEGKKYVPLSISIDDIVLKEDIFIGTFIAKTGSIKVDFNDQLDLQDKSIDVYLGVELAASIEYVPIGTFNIYEVSNDTEYKIIDNRIKFNTLFDATKVVFPTTPLLLLKEACKQANVELLTTDFPNKDLTISSEVFFGYDATCANVVEAIAQATCAVAKVSRGNNLELRWFNKREFTIEITNQSKYPTIENVYGPINSLVLAREPQNDNVFIQDEQSIKDNGLTELKISNNPLLDIDRYTSRIEIFNRINGFSYIPLKVESQGFFHLDTLDIVSLQQRDGTYIDMLIMNHTIKYSGGVASTFETPALTKTQIKYSVASSIESKIYRTELEVDKVKNVIKAEIEQINTKITQTDEVVQSLNTSFTIQQGKIEQVIKDTTVIINGEEKTTKEMYSYVQQQIDQINFAISESGGNNRLLNSAGWNSTNYWEVEGQVSSYTNVDIRENTISGYAFDLKVGKMSQTFKTIANRRYSVGCKIKKSVNACYAKIITNAKDIFLFKLPTEHIDGWVTFNMAFEALGSDTVIEVGSQGETLIVSDIMINDGEIIQQWSSSNDEIYTLNVKIDKSGIEISQDDTSNKTIINTKEFAGYDGNKEVFSVNGDTTHVNRLTADSDVQIGVVRLYAKTTGSKQGLGFAFIKGGGN